MRLRAIRGATTAVANTREAIFEATHELVAALIQQNDLDPADLVSAHFTLTGDLDAAFPAEAARAMGWGHVPLLCMREIDVPGSLRRCVRVMIHTYTAREAAELRHLYLRGASVLRPDLAQPQ